jgi:hypothetical protein
MTYAELVAYIDHAKAIGGMLWPYALGLGGYLGVAWTHTRSRVGKRRAKRDAIEDAREAAVSAHDAFVPIDAFMTKQANGLGPEQRAAAHHAWVTAGEAVDRAARKLDRLEGLTYEQRKARLEGMPYENSRLGKQLLHYASLRNGEKDETWLSFMEDVTDS